MTWTLWLAFFAAAWAISFSPGPGAVAVMSASLQHGFARGYFATFGLVLGFWTQLIVVAVGLGALIATSALAFAVVKWLGVGYLVYLGMRQWRAPPLALPDAGRSARRARRGAGSSPKRGSSTPSTQRERRSCSRWCRSSSRRASRSCRNTSRSPRPWTFTDLVVNALYAALAARLLGAPANTSASHRDKRVFGSLFVGLGVLLATFKRA